jgi:hypothetical protein
MTNEDALQTLADILRECQHASTATNPDTIRAALQRVKAVAQSALHPATLDLGVAWRNATVAEAMADTVDPPPPLPGYSDTYYQPDLKRRVIE